MAGSVCCPRRSIRVFERIFSRAHVQTTAFSRAGQRILTGTFSISRTNAMTIETRANLANTFHELHEKGCFVIPNPWDVGSAKLLAQLGFQALASTSSGFSDRDHRQPYSPRSRPHHAETIVCRRSRHEVRNPGPGLQNRLHREHRIIAPSTTMALIPPAMLPRAPIAPHSSPE